jgi:hypothetical protein
MKQSEFTSQVNKWKAGFDTTEPAPAPTFKPLVVKPHPRQADIDAFKAIPSRFK